MTTETARETTTSGMAGHQAEPPQDLDNQAVIAAIRGHHQQLADQLAELTAAVLTAAADDGGDAERVALYGWYRSELLPHAKAEERALYNRGADLEATALLVRGMIDEHASLRGLIDDLAGTSEPLLTATVAASAKALFDVHLSKENDLLLPALDAAGVDLAAALAGMHEVLGHGAGGQDQGGDGGPGAGEHAGRPHDHSGDGHHGAGPAPAARPEPAASPITGIEELDVRELPHQQRHTVIFAKLNALAADGTFVIVNDHDPVPLRYQADALWPGKFEWTYRESGPDLWRVAITLAR